MLCISRAEDAERRRQGDAELGLLDQGEQVLGPLADLALLLASPPTVTSAVRDFCATRGACAWVVSRIDDLELVHLDQVADEPGPELAPQLLEQPLDGVGQVSRDLRQHLHRGRLLLGRRLGRDPDQVRPADCIEAAARIRSLRRATPVSPSRAEVTPRLSAVSWFLDWSRPRTRNAAAQSSPRLPVPLVERVSSCRTGPGPSPRGRRRPRRRPFEGGPPRPSACRRGAGGAAAGRRTAGRSRGRPPCRGAWPRGPGATPASPLRRIFSSLVVFASAMICCWSRASVSRSGRRVLIRSSRLPLRQREPGPAQHATLFLDDPVELAERLPHLAEPRQLELEVEVLGQQQVAEVLQLGDQLLGLGLGVAELLVVQQLLGLAHLLEDLLLAQNRRARLSREAFSGSRPRSASESRNIRSSSSVICAATFCWVKPMTSRSDIPGFLSSFFFPRRPSSSRQPLPSRRRRPSRPAGPLLLLRRHRRRPRHHAADRGHPEDERDDRPQATMSPLSSHRTPRDALVKAEGRRRNQTASAHSPARCLTFVEVRGRLQGNFSDSRVEDASPSLHSAILPRLQPCIIRAPAGDRPQENVT